VSIVNVTVALNALQSGMAALDALVDGTVVGQADVAEGANTISFALAFDELREGNVPSALSFRFNGSAGNSLTFTSININGRPVDLGTYLDHATINAGMQTGSVASSHLQHLLALQQAPPNHAPVAQADSFTALSNHAISGNVLVDNGHGADRDPEGDILGVQAATLTTAAGGQILLNADGTFVYNPAANYRGADSFGYTISDGHGGTATGMASLTVGNQGPVAQADVFTGVSNQVVTGNVLADNGRGVDSDPEGDGLAVQAASLTTVAGGSVVLNADGTFTYNPAANYHGSDSFNYTINDGHGGTASATASVAISPPPVAASSGGEIVYGANVPYVDTGAHDHRIPGDDFIYGTDAVNDVLIGTNQWDVIYGMGGNDTIHGNGGGDNIDGGTGSNKIWGDAGDDMIVVSGSTGANTLYGDGGADLTSGSNGSGYADGHDAIVGGSGADTIYGEGGDDTLSGAGGIDLLYGGDGNDLLSGGAGNDIIYATSIDTAAATTLVSSSNHPDVSFGMAGNSFYQVITGSYTYAQAVAAAAAITMNGVAGHLVVIASAAEQADINNLLTTLGSTGQFWAGGSDSATEGSWNWTAGPENTGTFSDNSGAAQNNLFTYWQGGAPADTTHAEDYTAVNASNSGYWTANAGTATFGYIVEWDGVSFSADTSTDSLTGGTGDDVVYGGAGNDTLDGGSGNDNLYGGAANDTMTGGDGNDVLTGGVGADAINGGNGDDVIALANGDFAAGESITGGANTDTVLLTNATTVDFTTGTLATVETLSGSSGNDTVTMAAASVAALFTTVDLGAGTADVLNTVGDSDISAATLATLSNVETGNITGTAGNDTFTVTGTQLNALIIGSGTVNMGGGTADTINLKSTSSDLNTLGGTDASIQGVEIISASAAASGVTITLSGQSEAFAVTGSASVDTITAGSGADTISGGAGADTLDGGNGNDTFNLANGDFASGESITGGSGTADATVLTNATTVDFTTGTLATVETLTGSSGNDTVTMAAASTIMFTTINLGAGTADVLNTVGNSDISAGTLATISNVETANITGTSGNDTFTVTGAQLDALIIGSGLINMGGGSADTINLKSTSSDLNTSGATADSFVQGLEVISASAAISAVTINLSGQTEAFTITGSANADTITGGSGADTIDGGAGNDTIEGGLGIDTLTGGADTDLLTYAGATAGVTVSLATTTAQNTGGAGTDTISGFENLTGSAYNDTLTGDAGNNVIEGGAGNDVLDGGAGTDTASFAGATASVAVSLATTTAQNTGGAGTDTISGFENLTGSAYNDTLTGDGGNNTIIGGAGNNTLDGGAGTDTLDYSGATAAVNVNLSVFFGGQIASANGYGGTDTLSHFESVIGSAFNDNITGSDGGGGSLYGGAGNDSISPLFGFSYTIDGGSGTDGLNFFLNGSGPSVINLAAGTGTNGQGGTLTITNVENIFGDAYNDTYTGDSGANSIYGAAGSDTIDGGLGNDTLDGGTGTDTLLYTSATAGVTVSLAVTTAQNTGGAGTDTIVNFENLTGSSYNDTLTGDSGNNTIEGGLGNDVLSGGAGTDTLSYASATAGITVNLSTTTAQNTGGAGTDTVSGFENLTGAGFSDTLTGDSGANAISGGDGNDIITGGAGADTLDGGNGNDTFNLANGDFASGETLTGGAGNDTIVLTNAATVDFTTGTLSAVESLTGSAGNDAVTMLATHYAGMLSAIDLAGDTDTLTVVVSGSMDITASAAATISNVELGILNGTAANDTLTITGAQLDALMLGLVAAINMGAGTDTLNLTSNSVRLTDLGVSGDFLITGLEIISAAAVSGNVTISMASQTEGFTVTGGSGNDALTGGSGADSISGGNGNDTISGGAGADTLDGGSGNDVFNFANGDFATGESITGGANTDTIVLTNATTVDFTTGTLATVETLTGSSGNDSVTIWATSYAGMLSAIDLGAGNDTLAVKVSGTVDISGIAAATVTNVSNAGLQGSASDDTITMTGAQLTAILLGFGANILLGSGTDTINLTSTSTGLNSLGTNSDFLFAQTEIISGALAASGIYITVTGQTEGFTLIGSSGNDTLTGGSGDDTIDGGLGNDTLTGGPGNDTVSYASATAGVTVNISLGTAQNTAGAGTDTLSGFEKVIGSAYNDRLTAISTGGSTVDGAGGDDTLIGTNFAETFFGGAGSDNISSAAGGDYVDGGDGNDSITTGNGADTVYGGNGDDAISTAAGSDYIDGGAGNDSISTANATATIYGGDGNDTISTAAGNDTINGDNGDDYITSGGGNDTASGGAGNDTIDGGAGTDVLDGGTGTDTVSYNSIASNVTVDLSVTIAQNTGGGGTDTITNFENILGGAGNDTLTGDGNNNTIDGGIGNDIMNGGAGTDTLSYESGTAGVTISLAVTTAQNTGGMGTDTISNFENLLGSNFNDTLAGTSGNNTLDGGIGNDLLDYGAATAGVTVSLAVTTAQNTGGAGTDTISHFESIKGSAYSDTLTSGASDSLTAQVNAILAANSGVSYDTRTGNFYLFVNSLLGEPGAMNDAASRTINGVAGHVAMPFTSYENALLDSLSGANDIWLGARDTVTEGKWLMVGGAMDGVQVWQGAAGGSAQNSLYTNWLAGQPDGGTSANYMEMANGGQWTDRAGNTNTRTYVVEWDGSQLLAPTQATTLEGGAGSDILYGASGADAFVFLATDNATTNPDTIYNFDYNTTTSSFEQQHDTIDIKDLLTGYVAGTSDPDVFASFVASGNDLLLKVDRDGSGATYSMQTIATLVNANTAGTAYFNVEHMVHDGYLVMS
jgi:Ca2+-binding RTX toxin-like protein